MIKHLFNIKHDVKHSKLHYRINIIQVGSMHSSLVTEMLNQDPIFYFISANTILQDLCNSEPSAAPRLPSSQPLFLNSCFQCCKFFTAAFP